MADPAEHVIWVVSYAGSALCYTSEFPRSHFQGFPSLRSWHSKHSEPSIAIWGSLTLLPMCDQWGNSILHVDQSKSIFRSLAWILACRHLGNLWSAMFGTAQFCFLRVMTPKTIRNLNETKTCAAVFLRKGKVQSACPMLG